jgi:hypothetical protein
VLYIPTSEIFGLEEINKNEIITNAGLFIVWFILIKKKKTNQSISKIRMIRNKRLKENNLGKEKTVTKD